MIFMPLRWIKGGRNPGKLLCPVAGWLLNVQLRSMRAVFNGGNGQVTKDQRGFNGVMTTAFGWQHICPTLHTAHSCHGSGRCNSLLHSR
jgi:hypothetical protein